METFSDEFSVAAERHMAAALNNLRLQSLDDAPKEIRQRILKEARDITNKNVFGEGHKTKKGVPQEQGLGSHANPTRNSIEAYIKTQTERRLGGPEEGFEENLKAMRARLTEVEEEKRAKKKDAGDDN